MSCQTIHWKHKHYSFRLHTFYNNKNNNTVDKLVPLVTYCYWPPRRDLEVRFYKSWLWFDSLPKHVPVVCTIVPATLKMSASAAWSGLNEAWQSLIANMDVEDVAAHSRLQVVLFQDFSKCHPRFFSLIITHLLQIVAYNIGKSIVFWPDLAGLVHDPLWKHVPVATQWFLFHTSCILLQFPPVVKVKTMLMLSCASLLKATHTMHDRMFKYTPAQHTQSLYFFLMENKLKLDCDLQICSLLCARQCNGSLTL